MGSEIVLSSFNISKFFKDLAKHFHVRVEDDPAEYRLQIPSSHGDGWVSGLDFSGGLSLFSFHVKLKKSHTLVYRIKKQAPLRLLFCTENFLCHQLKKENLQTHIHAMTGAMTCPAVGRDQQLLIPADKLISFFCIDVDRRVYSEKFSRTLGALPPSLKEVFNNDEQEKSFYYQGSYGPEISECLQNITKVNYKGTVRQVYLESQALEILSMMIRQYIDDVSPEKRQNPLRKRDMELIIEARNHLLADLASPPTIKELAQITGTNENKLKAGFRAMYNTTINKMLQDERLIRARTLMTEESLPIREVAKMVGYSHSAHFASKFKKRFGILPNEYIKRLLR